MSKYIEKLKNYDIRIIISCIVIIIVTVVILIVYNWAKQKESDNNE